MNRKIFIKMFKEIIKHGERDDCYECYKIMRELNLKKKVEDMEKQIRLSLLRLMKKPL